MGVQLLPLLKSKRRFRFNRSAPGVAMDTRSRRSEGYGVVRLRRPEWYWSCALLLAGSYVASSLYISAHRLLWFDEILTALISRLPNLPSMWKALSEVAEQTPPLYFLITRTFDQMFHHADIGLRVPSALALGAGLLVTFDTARRLTDGLYGLIAMSFLATRCVTYYGYEARSYALYFMLAAIALWLWVSTKAESKIAAAAFGVVFLIGLAIHYYFLLCLVPFGITVLTERRIFHPKVIAATAGVSLSLVALYPNIASARSFANSLSPVFWQASMTGVLRACLDFLPNAILPLVVIAIAVVTFGRSREHAVPSMSAGERVSWLFLVVPLVAYLLGRLVTHQFHNRYIIGAGPGMVVAATCLMWRHCRESRPLSLALLLAFGGSAVTQQLLTLRNLDHIKADSGDYQERTRQTLALDDTLLREGKQHIVFNWDVQYLEAWYYSKHRVHYECITSEDRWAIENYVPLHFVSVEMIVANASQTAVIFPSPTLAEALARAGLHLRVRSVITPSPTRARALARAGLHLLARAGLHLRVRLGEPQVVVYLE